MNNTIPTNSQKNSLSSNWTNRLTVQIINDLAEKYGEVVIGPGAKPNEFFLANLYFTFQKVIFEKNEGIFYKYDHTTGLWKPQNDQNICNCIHQFVREFDNSPLGVGLLPKMQLSVCKQVLEVLKGLPGCCTTFNTPRDRKIIHTQNTMLEYDQETKNWVSHPFAPEYMSRNRTEIPYVPNARPNQFISDLLQPALSQSDIDILQMYMGQILLGQNISQRILFITGTAGGGKSTLVNVIESLVSLANCTELRLDNSSQRFETSRYIGKTLLTAKDVHSLFLNSKLAHKLKALTGKDAQSVEFKGKKQLP